MAVDCNQYSLLSLVERKNLNQWLLLDLVGTRNLNHDDVLLALTVLVVEGLRAGVLPFG